MSEPSTNQGPDARAFVWPPRTPVEVALPPSHADPRTAVPSAQARADARAFPSVPQPTIWDQIEQTWLDPIAPPLRRRMDVEQWAPDNSARYCHNCGETAGRHEVVGEDCPNCRGTRPPWERIIRLGEYRAPLRSWIHEVKFTRFRSLARDLGRLLGEAVVEEIASVRAIRLAEVPDAPPIVVPVPTTPWRRIIRGIDHSNQIALGVAERVRGRVVQPLVREPRPSQLHVAPSRRAANVAGAIHPKPAWRRPDLGGRLVIVVDDVSTSGATLRAACRAAGLCRGTSGRPHVWAAVLAKTPRDAHEVPMT